MGSSYDNNLKVCVVAKPADPMICGAGTYRDGDGLCKPYGICTTGTFWDPALQACRPATDCLLPRQWDAASNNCRLIDAWAEMCREDQVLISGSCQSCPEGMMLDLATRSCRPFGACRLGYEFNPVSNQCEIAQIRECNPDSPMDPTPPTFDIPVSMPGAIKLTWSGPADGYVLIRTAGESSAIELKDTVPYTVRDFVDGQSMVVFRGNNTMFVDMEAKEAGQTYTYQLFAVNLFCAGPFYSEPGMISARPQNVASSSLGEFAGASELTLMPMPPMTAQPGGIGISWVRALTEFEGSFLSANYYLLARFEPTEMMSEWDLPSFSLDRMFAGADLGGGWRMIFTGENNGFFDVSTLTEPDKHLKPYVYALAAVYRTEVGPKIASSIIKQQNIPVPLDAETPVILAIALDGDIADGWYNEEEKLQGNDLPLIKISKGGPESVVNYLVVTENVACETASGYLSSAGAKTLLSGKSDGAYKVCISLTSGEIPVVYGDSPVFRIDTNKPNIDGILTLSEAGTTSGLTVTGAKTVWWQNLTTLAPNQSFSFTDPYSLITSFVVSQSGVYNLRLSAKDDAGNIHRRDFSPIEITSANDATTSVSAMVVNGPSLLVTGVCTPYKVNLTNTNGGAATLVSSAIVVLSAQGAQIFSDANCSASSSYVVIESGQSEAIFHVRTGPSSEPNAEIHANLGSFSSSLVVNRAYFQLKNAATDNRIVASEGSDLNSVISAGSGAANVTVSYAINASDICSAGNYTNTPPSAKSLYDVAGTPEYLVVCVRFSVNVNGILSHIVTHSPRIAIVRTSLRMDLSTVWFVSGAGCSEVRIKFLDTNNQQAVLPESLNVDYKLSNIRTFYRDASCANGLDENFQIPANQSEFKIYFQSTKPADIRIIIRDVASMPSVAPAMIYIPFQNKLYAGPSHTCRVWDAGRLQCWGSNSDGQIGDGSQDDKLNPFVDYSWSGLRSVAMGEKHTCILGSDLQVRCWGDGGNGQLGINLLNPVRQASLASAVSFPTGRIARSIAAGTDHTCALLDNQMAACWGDNTYGQLGDNSNAASSRPVMVDNGNLKFIQLAAGGHSTCGLTFQDSYKVYCWGRNQFGQLGIGSLQSQSLPQSVDLGEVTDATPDPTLRLAMGPSHTCVFGEYMGLKCWGNNTTGQLGVTSANTTVTAPTIPVIYGTPIDLALGRTHSCLQVQIDNNYRLVCWGKGEHGQLGYGSFDELNALPSLPSTNLVSTALESGALAPLTVLSLASGFDHTCAVTGSGPKCWGQGTLGALGNGQTGPIAWPTDVVYEPIVVDPNITVDPNVTAVK